MASEADKNYTRFANKWPKDVADGGFTAIPNVLLKNLYLLDLTAPELALLILLEMYRWDAEDMPWPSVKTLADLMVKTPRHITRLLASLEAKGLLKRHFNRNKSTSYSTKPLADRLQNLATPDNSVTTSMTFLAGGGDDYVS